jgi:hypothetical protein
LDRIYGIFFGLTGLEWGDTPGTGVVLLGEWPPIDIGGYWGARVGP